MSACELHRSPTYSPLEQIAPLAIGGLVGCLVAVAMQIWPDSDDSTSDPETPSATPSPWINSLIMMFALSYSAIYVSVLAALSLRFDYVEEFGVPARRTTGPIQVPQRLESEFAQPTYRAGMIAQVISLMVFRVVAQGFGGPQHLVSVLSIFFTTPVFIVACLVSAKSTGRLKRFLDYEEM